MVPALAVWISQAGYVIRCCLAKRALPEHADAAPVEGGVGAALATGVRAIDRGPVYVPYEADHGHTIAQGDD